MKFTSQPTPQKTSVSIQPLISAKEPLAILGVSKRTVWRQLSSRRLPEPLRIGGSLRWRHKQIQQWIEQGCSDRSHYPFD